MILRLTERWKVFVFWPANVGRRWTCLGDLLGFISNVRHRHITQENLPASMWAFHFQSVVKLGNQKDATEQCHSNQKHVGSIIAFSGILTQNSVPSHRTEMTRLHPTFLTRIPKLMGRGNMSLLWHIPTFWNFPFVKFDEVSSITRIGSNPKSVKTEELHYLTSQTKMKVDRCQSLRYFPGIGCLIFIYNVFFQKTGDSNSYKWPVCRNMCQQTNKQTNKPAS